MATAGIVIGVIFAFLFISFIAFKMFNGGSDNDSM